FRKARAGSRASALAACAFARNLLLTHRSSNRSLTVAARIGVALIRAPTAREGVFVALAASQGDQRAVHRNAAAHFDAQQRREGDQTARVVTDAWEQIADALRIANK